MMPSVELHTKKLNVLVLTNLQQCPVVDALTSFEGDGVELSIVHSIDAMTRHVIKRPTDLIATHMLREHTDGITVPCALYRVGHIKQRHTGTLTIVPPLLWLTYGQPGRFEHHAHVANGMNLNVALVNRLGEFIDAVSTLRALNA